MWPKTPNEAVSNGGVRIAVSDQNGAFKFSNAIPGDYYVVAWEDLPDRVGPVHRFPGQVYERGEQRKIGRGRESRRLQVNLVGRDKITAQVANLR